MNVNIETLLPDLEALTPDGRWAMLQKWLKENPEYGERADRWSTESVDTVFAEILNITTKKYGPLASIVLGTIGIEIKIKSAIEVMQACYRERAGEQTEKEIKNVRAKRIASPKRRGQSRRTSQDRD